MSKEIHLVQNDREKRYDKGIRFVLNNREVCALESPTMVVLDYLRNVQRLTGTKEGCREGDCGACTVLVGELQGNCVRYKTVASCLMPLAELQGKHLVTIEGINLPDLTPIQRAIVEYQATQCGFCTPGIVISLTGYLLARGARANGREMAQILGGHLCRCTGYSSLKRAIHSLLSLVEEWAQEDPRLRSENPMEALVDRKVIPSYFSTIAGRLAKLSQPSALSPSESSPIIMAGGTDVYVQRGSEVSSSSVLFLNLREDPELKGISCEEGKIRVGALTTFEEFSHNLEIQRAIPNISHYMKRVASLQIRNRATIGGNIINASPIGDIAILLLVMGTTLKLERGKDGERWVPLAKFYKGYKQLEKEEGEVLTQIAFPIPEPGTLIYFEKVSKRKYLDIA